MGISPGWMGPRQDDDTGAARVCVRSSGPRRRGTATDRSRRRTNGVNCTVRHSAPRRRHYACAFSTPAWLGHRFPRRHRHLSPNPHLPPPFSLPHSLRLQALLTLDAAPMGGAHLDLLRAQSMLSPSQDTEAQKEEVRRVYELAKASALASMQDQIHQAGVGDAECLANRSGMLHLHTIIAVTTVIFIIVIVTDQSHHRHQFLLNMESSSFGRVARGGHCVVAADQRVETIVRIGQDCCPGEFDGGGDRSCERTCTGSCAWRCSTSRSGGKSQRWHGQARWSRQQ